MVRPDERKREWGDGFPWIANYLDQILDDHQRAVFLSWLSHFYVSALKRDLRKGQAIFFAGPTGIGKTFLSQCLVGGLMGGFSEAKDFLLGKTEFNSQLFNAPCWTIDDSEASADVKAHELYTQVIKKVVANYHMTYRKMYNNPVTLPWEGRVFVTLNDDPESISMLPNVEQSILDKVIFLKARQTKLQFKGAEDTVKSELPFLGSFLRGYQIPDELVGDYRYGVIQYHHPELLQIAKDHSSTSSIADIVQSWRCRYFTQSTEARWEGTSLELLQELQETDSLRTVAMKSIHSPHYLGKNLNKMIIQKIAPWLSSRRLARGNTYWIARPDERE